MASATHWEGLPCSVSAWQSQRLLRVPGLSCTLTYSCPTGCTETDWHPRASEGSRALPLLPPRSSSLGAAAADGLWRLNHLAHGGYCGLPIVKCKGHIWGQDWIGVARTTLFTLTPFLLTIAFSFVRDIDRYAKVIGQHTLSKTSASAKFSP